MAKGGFTHCEFEGRKAIRYHHDFGDFDFVLIQAEDGTQDIKFVANVPGLSHQAVEKIGRLAITSLRSTAKALKYPVPEENLTFPDAINILNEAQNFLTKSAVSR